MTFFRLRAIRREMAALKDQILRSAVLTPDDYDGREPMWMRREDLRVSLTA